MNFVINQTDRREDEHRIFEQQCKLIHSAFIQIRRSL